MTVERRYRLILRLFPKAWREENEAVFLDTLLEHGRDHQERIRTADLVDLVRTAAVLHWRAISRFGARAEVSATILLTASAGLALLSAASIGLLARLWLTGTGLRGGTVTAADLLVATLLLATWPLVLALATTRRTAVSALLCGTSSALLAVSYLIRSTREFNFVSLDHLFLYLGLPLVVTLMLSSVANTGERIDRRWIAVAGFLAVPLTIFATEVQLHRFWSPPEPYASAVMTLVVAGLVVSVPALLAIGVFRPCVLFAGAFLYTPLGAAGFGQLVDSLIIQNPPPGRAISEFPQAIAVTAMSLLPTAALLIAGIVVLLHKPRPTVL